jgi:hypothetical protein
MKKIASSPERHTFQKEGYVKHCEEEGKLPNPAYLEMYKSWREQDVANLEDPKWQKNNMEYDLRSSKELCDKVKASENYAQNLYAAMCNMDWQSREFWQELKGETWSCSWRHAGGIVADMREQGDYIDWYCSGIGNPELGNGLDGTVPDVSDGRTYVPEGQVTEEIELDLNRLGWRPVPYKDEEL